MLRDTRLQLQWDVHSRNRKRPKARYLLRPFRPLPTPTLQITILLPLQGHLKSPNTKRDQRDLHHRRLVLYRLVIVSIRGVVGVMPVVVDLFLLPSRPHPPAVNT